MKKIFTLIALVLSLAGHVKAQQTFVQTLGSVLNETGNDLVQTSDSGYVVTGSVSNGTEEDMYLAKFDKNGALVWEKRYGGPYNQVGTSIAQLPWGGFVIAGTTTSYGSGDVFITKTDANGDTLWTRDYGSGGLDLAKVIEVTAGGNYHLTGVFKISGTNKPGILTVDSNGVQIAVNFISNNFASPDYRAHYLHGNRMGITGGGEMLVFTDTMGVYSGQLPQGSTGKSIDACYIPGGYYAIAHWADYGTANTNCGLLLTDTNAAKIWDIKLTSADDDLPVWVKPDGHGGIMVALMCRNTSSFISKMVVVAVDMQGNIKWQNRYNPGGNNNHVFGNIISTLDGGYAIIGGYGSSASSPNDLVLIKTDSIGNSGCDFVAHTLTAGAALESTSIPASGLVWSLANTGLLIHPLAVTPFATVNMHCNSITSVSEVKALDVTLWPNPARDFLHVRTGFSNIDYTITDPAGRMHLSGKLNSSGTIAVGSLGKGIYFLNLKEGQSAATTKFIIE